MELFPEILDVVSLSGVVLPMGPTLIRRVEVSTL